jgi:hypothetical protein
MTTNVQDGVILAGLRGGDTELAVALWRSAVRCGRVTRTVVKNACARDDLKDVIGELVGHCDWETELFLTEQPGLSEATLDSLSRSKRGRTLRKLAARNDLGEKAARRLLRKKSQPGLVSGGLAQGSLPTSVRRDLLCDPDCDHDRLVNLGRWCDNDEAFATWYITGLVTVHSMASWFGLLRVRGGYDRWVRAVDKALTFLPGTAQTSELQELGDLIIAHATPRALDTWVSRTSPRGHLLVSAIKRAEELAEERDLANSIAQRCSKTFRVRGRGTSRMVWGDDDTVDLAGQSSCPALARPALRSSKVSASLRAQAVYGDDEDARLAVATNTALTRGEVDHLLTVFDGKDLWLVRRAAALEADHRLEIARRAPGSVVSGLAELLEDDETPAWAEGWWTQDVCAEVLAHREETDNRWSFCNWAARVLDLHPSLVGQLVRSIRGNDVVTTELADALVNDLSDQLGGGGAADVFVSLLQDWSGVVSDLAVTAGYVGEAQ